jgi:nucleotide-binding universal stress UspA family protein
LNAFAEKEVPAEIQWTCFVDSGVAYSCITSAAEKWNADLIVIGTHGQGWIPNALLGSTAERVVRHARCPVLVVRGRERRGTKAAFSPKTIRRILVPTDFSDNSMEALPYAVEWAREFGARLHLTHIVSETLPSDLTHLGVAISEDNRLKKSGERELERIAQTFVPENVRAESRVVVGVPAHEICKAAQKSDADLIVLASHGRTGFQHFWIGSVAERVVRHAPCAVLVIHNSSKPPRA